VEATSADLTVEDQPQGVTIRFSFGAAPLRVTGPQVNGELVGVFPTVGQTIEDRDGRPLVVDTDFNGRRFSRPVPGPLADLQEGKNTISWSLPKP
jgi:hypothetical protein